MLTKLTGVKTAEEAMIKSGLDWFVDQTPIVAANGIVIDSHKALFRSDTNKLLGVVGTGYVPIQNTACFAFFDVVTTRYELEYSSAGSIKDGQKIFLQAKLNRSFDAQKDDRVDCFLTIVSAHNGSSSCKAFLCPVRLRCENALNRAIKSATTNIALRHTASAMERFKDAFLVFKMSTEAFEIFKEKARYLANKQCDRHTVDRFLKEVLPQTGSTRRSNQHQTVIRLFESGLGNQAANSWELYNSVVEAVDYGKLQGGDPEKILDSALFGAGADLKERAFEAALRL